MNKEKVFKIIDELKREINENTLPEAKLYVDTWVIGGLTMLERKLNHQPTYPQCESYEYFFREFVCKFFCRNIDPKIKVYAIASVFSYKTRTLVISLFESMFQLSYRNQMCKLRGYIEWNELTDDLHKFEVIRHCTQTKRSMDIIL